MIDKNFEIQMEQVQEMSWEDFQEVCSFFNCWDRWTIAGSGEYFDPYPLTEERDLDKNEEEWQRLN